VCFPFVLKNAFKANSQRSYTNTQLHLDNKKELLNLCSQICGMSNVTNHEFMSWVVKGNIGRMKGYNVNWVQTATSSTKEKAHSLGVENLKNN
jgi:hypothetical protein